MTLSQTPELDGRGYLRLPNLLPCRLGTKGASFSFGVGTPLFRPKFHAAAAAAIFPELLQVVHVLFAAIGVS